MFALLRRHTIIGRSPGADIRIEDSGVSRRHVKLSIGEDGSIVVADMRSTNGMIVNGEKLERATLREGDTLRLGPDALLRVRMLAQAEIHDRVADELIDEPIDEPAESGSSLTRTEDRLLERDEVTVIAAMRPRPKAEDLPLSARQIEVGRLVAAGLTNAGIAERLGISPRTVTSHLDHIYGRLGIGSRAALTRWIVERGLLEPESNE